jgi:hypothetical protein
MDEDHDDKVGYGKPPKKAQFKEGESGNPRGRPRGTKNLKTDLREELGERITIREGERVLKISKQRAILKSLYAKAVKGDPRALAVVLNLISNLIGLDATDGETNRPMNDDELELLEVLEQRLLSRTNSKKPGGEPEKGGGPL